jgi:hypothetical protein
MQAWLQSFAVSILYSVDISYAVITPYDWAQVKFGTIRKFGKTHRPGEWHHTHTHPPHPHTHTDRHTHTHTPTHIPLPVDVAWLRLDWDELSLDSSSRSRDCRKQREGNKIEVYRLESQTYCLSSQTGVAGCLEDTTRKYQYIHVYVVREIVLYYFQRYCLLSVDFGIWTSFNWICTRSLICMCRGRGHDLWGCGNS